MIIYTVYDINTNGRDEMNTQIENAYEAGFNSTENAIIPKQFVYPSPEFSAYCKGKSTREDAERLAEKKVIKKYCNFHGYSDSEPYEVVKTISAKTVEIRAMDAEFDKSHKLIQHVGGFSAHTVNNGGKWFIKSNEKNPTMRVRGSEANQQWQKGKHMRFSMADAPYKFYDYNF